MQPHSHRLPGHSSWHSLSPEKRPLKRYRPTSGHQDGSRFVLAHPDVYPQDPKQEEDKMNGDRLQKGYQLAVMPMEYETLCKSLKLERFDEGFAKSSQWLVQIMQKKNEQNLIILDKKRLKEGTFQSFLNSNASSSIIAAKKEYTKFFEDLARGKSLQTLTKRFPNFKKKEESMDLMYECKVPIQKAIWFFKMNQVAHSTLTFQNKPKRPNNFEQFSTDQAKLFTKYLREKLRKFDVVPHSQQLEILNSYLRLPYFICLFKHSFEEGILDRHDFLMDLCDITAEYANFSWEKPQIFRLLFIFLSQFVDLITQNVVLSRKLAYIIVNRFKAYKRDYDRKTGCQKNGPIDEKFMFSLIGCHYQHTTVLAMLGLFHAIIIDCPAALVYNPFDAEPYCGSPLDMLPGLTDLLSVNLPKSAAKIDSLLKFRIEEIRKRSWNVDNRWVLNSDNQCSFELLIDVCLNVLSALDKVVLNSPKALLKLYKKIFASEPAEKVQQTLLVRIRMILQWAVTIEREGSHRALVACHLLRMRRRHFCSNEWEFGGHSLQDIFIDFLYRDAPVPGAPHFHQEYANLMHLFYELQRFDLFSHDAYVRALIRSGQFNYREPMLNRLQLLMETPKASTSLQSNSTESALLQQQHNISSASLDNLSNTNSSTINSNNNSLSDPAIISFIPTAPVVSSASSNFINSSTTGILSSSLSVNSSVGGRGSNYNNTTKSVTDFNKEFASLPSTRENADEHCFLTELAQLTVHERFLIHLPIEQTERQRDACNQRAILMYGISDARDQARQELRKIASQICKIWQKKIVAEFLPNASEIRYKRRNNLTEQITDALNKFRTQSYYDQLVICGWCADSFLEVIRDFINCNSTVLPLSDGLDIICSMMLTCRNVHGIVTLAADLLSLLISMEKLLSSFRSDYVPGTIATQLAYVMVAYLADNFYYFLYSEDAPSVINGLFRVVEKELCTDGYPISGWSRAIIMFVYHAKSEMLNAKLCGGTQLLLGTAEMFQKRFPESGVDEEPRELRFNRLFFTDFLNDVRHTYSYSYHDYKAHLPSIEDEHTQYSFIVNAFLAARNAGRDFAHLVDLASFCGHISAEKPLAGKWCVAIQELCYPSVSNDGYIHLVKEINVDEPSTHYPIVTFVMLLASKYCFSSHALIIRLLNNVFNSFIKKESASTSTNSNGFDGSEMGLCLALLIATTVVCGTDVPFLLNYDSETASTSAGNASGGSAGNSTGGVSDKTSGGIFTKTTSGRCADEWAMRIIHIRELDSCIFPLLSAISILSDMVKRKSGANYKLKRLQETLKCSLLAMCEEEWVIDRVFRICESTDLEALISPRLKSNTIGQQLLRIALRRRSERSTKQQLMVCNGNSKKSLLDKLLSALTLWNVRATFYDFKLMIKGVSPEPMQKHYHQVIIEADLFMQELGKCCRDLFLNCRAEDYHKMTRPTDKFSFRQINCYWLIAPLVNVCPKPYNIPQSHPSPLTLKAKFLAEAASELDTAQVNTKDRLHQSARLLSQQPFLNLVLTCAQGEELDNLVSSLLRHIQAIINRVKENPTLLYQDSFALERECLLLRLNLVCGIFDSLLVSASTSETWALALFQLMFYEVISADRDKDYFDICYDMLSMLVQSMVDASSSQSQTFSDSDKRSESRNRSSAYNSFVKKIKKELSDRSIPFELNCLSQLLPIPKSTAELTAWDSFSSNSPQKSAQAGKTNGTSQNSAVRLDKQPEFVQRQLVRLLYHSHYNEISSTGMACVATGSGDELSSRVVDVFLSTPAVEYIHTDLYNSSLPQMLSRQAAVMTGSANGGVFSGGEMNMIVQSHHLQNQQQHLHKQMRVGFSMENGSNIYSGGSSGISSPMVMVQPSSGTPLHHQPMQHMGASLASDVMHRPGVGAGADHGHHPSHNQQQPHQQPPHMLSMISSSSASTLHATPSSSLPGMMQLSCPPNQQQQPAPHSSFHQQQQPTGMLPQQPTMNRVAPSTIASSTQMKFDNVQPIGASQPPHHMTGVMGGPLNQLHHPKVGPTDILQQHQSKMSHGGPMLHPSQLRGQPMDNIPPSMVNTAAEDSGRLFGASGGGSMMSGGSAAGPMGGRPSTSSMGMMPHNPSMSGMGGMHSQHPSLVAQAVVNSAAVGFLSDSSRSGSSTPTSGVVNESPSTTRGGGGGGGRGGRRKNAAGGPGAGNGGAASGGRGQKRKKDQQQPKTGAGDEMGITGGGGQMPPMGMHHINPMMGGGGGPSGMDNMMGMMTSSGGGMMGRQGGGPGVIPPSHTIPQAQQPHQHMMGAGGSSSVSGGGGMPSSMMTSQQQQQFMWQMQQQQQQHQQHPNQQQHDFYQQQQQHFQQQRSKDSAAMMGAGGGGVSSGNHPAMMRMMDGSGGMVGGGMKGGGMMISGGHHQEMPMMGAGGGMMHQGGGGPGTIPQHSQMMGSSGGMAHQRQIHQMAPQQQQQQDSKHSLQQKILQKINAQQQVQNMQNSM